MRVARFFKSTSLSAKKRRTVIIIVLLYLSSYIASLFNLLTFVAEGNAELETIQSNRYYARKVEGLTVDVVLAHCNKNVSWLEEASQEILLSGQRIRHIHVYSMCGIDVNADVGTKFKSENLLKVSTLPNRGRNDMAYTYHIVSHFERLDEVDYIYFLKDSMVNYAIDFLDQLRIPFKEAALELASGKRFICLQRPDEGGMEWHLRRETWKFRLPQYTTAGSTYPDQNFEKSNVSMCEFLHETLGNGVFDHLRRQDFVKVCYGGSFATHTSKVKVVPLETWNRLLGRIQLHENGEVLHYMERTWASILSETGTLGVAVAGKFLTSYKYIAMSEDLGRHYPGMYLLDSQKANFSAKSLELIEEFQTEDSSFLLVSHELSRTGAPLYLLHVAKILIDVGKAVTLMSPSDGPLKNDFLSAGVQVIIDQMLHFEGYKWPCIRSFCPSPIELILSLVYSRTRSRPATVVFNTIMWADILSLSNKSRYCHNFPQIIWIIHEWNPEGTNYWPDITTIWPEYKREAIVGTDAMVFVSDESREQWYQFDGLVPFYTIPGYSVYNGKERQLSFNITRKTLDIPIDAFVITSVGTIDRRKQQAWSIDAVAKLRTLGINAILIMIGNADPLYFQQKIWPKQKNLGADIIRLVPEQSEIAPFLLLANLHVSSASEESYPLNTLEAMSLSIPVVATRAGGTGEQFPPEAAWMVSAVDHDDFIETVVKAATLKNLTEYGRILSKASNYSKKMFCDKMQGLFNGLFKSKQENHKCKMLDDCRTIDGPSYELLISNWKSYNNLSREEKLTLNIRRKCDMNGTFDSDFYKTNYRDLSLLSNESLRLHFEQHGTFEGRKGCRTCCPSLLSFD